MGKKDSRRYHQLFRERVWLHIFFTWGLCCPCTWEKGGGKQSPTLAIGHGACWSFAAGCGKEKSESGSWFGSLWHSRAMHGADLLELRGLCKGLVRDGKGFFRRKVLPMKVPALCKAWKWAQCSERSRMDCGGLLGQSRCELPGKTTPSVI